METILITVITVTVMGLFCACVLCVASKLMHVKVDERIAELEKNLPGVNCGVCGYPGCSGYAKALLSSENVKPNLCTPGGADVLVKISAILGVEAASIEKKTAIVNCAGDCKAQVRKMDYRGISSCDGAKKIYNGKNSCAFGCLGYGDCQKVCPADAICLENDLAYVIPSLCTGCGLCVKVCPPKIISIENASIGVFVACKNIEKGAVTRKKCSSGCIACTKCVKECPKNVIKIIDNLAVIDYSLCDNCGKCADVCVTKCIHHFPAVS